MYPHQNELTIHVNKAFKRTLWDQPDTFRNRALPFRDEWHWLPHLHGANYFFQLRQQLGGVGNRPLTVAIGMKDEGRKLGAGFSSLKFSNNVVTQFTEICVRSDLNTINFVVPVKYAKVEAH